MAPFLQFTHIYGAIFCEFPYKQASFLWPITGGLQPSAYVTVLPEHGTLHQHTTVGGSPAFEEISAVPTEVSVVLYIGLSSNQGVRQSFGGR